jgi:hypothetical protein
MALEPRRALWLSRQMIRLRVLAVAMLAVVIALAATGCSAVGGGPQPSKACGGFHLVVRNAGATAVAVSFNRQSITTIEPGQAEAIAEFGPRNPPTMPWDVVISRITDGVVLLSLHVVNDGSDGQSVTVSDQPLPSSPLTAYTCGQPLG